MRLGLSVELHRYPVGSWHYPTFNIADMAIVIGAGIANHRHVLEQAKGKGGNTTGRECASNEYTKGILFTSILCFGLGIIGVVAMR